MNWKKHAAESQRRLVFQGRECRIAACENQAHNMQLEWKRAEGIAPPKEKRRSRQKLCWERRADFVSNTY